MIQLKKYGVSLMLEAKSLLLVDMVIQHVSIRDRFIILEVRESGIALYSSENV